MNCPQCATPFEPGATRCSVCGAFAKLVPTTALSLRRAERPAAASVQPGLSSGTVLSERYRLEQKLGEGGMGTVYAAFDEELDRSVAIKLLNPQFVSDTEIVERFERESRLMAKLDHPNIVSVYDVGRALNQPYIVMKRLTGMTLSELLKSKGGLTPLETIGLVRQLGHGLDFIHQRGFIHRDIKASNVFVSPTQEVTILDFGILRARGAQAGLTRQGMVMGTPHYMAPEQALGMSDVDQQVDLYSLAIVIFECLSGTLPFEAESELQLIHLQAHAAPPDILQRAPWLPEALRPVMFQALAKDPKARFDSANDLVEAVAVACGIDQPGPRASSPPRSTPALKTAQLFRPSAPLPVRAPSLSALEAVVSSQNPIGPRRSLWWLVLAAAPVLAFGAWWTLPSLFLEPRAAVVPTPPDIVIIFDAGTSSNELTKMAQADEANQTPDAGEAVAMANKEEAIETPPVEAAVESVDKKTAPKRRSRVNVVTTHQGEPYWAQVSVDGVPKGRTPLLLDLDPGKHALKIERSGFRSMVREIRVASGKPLVLRIALTP